MRGPAFVNTQSFCYPAATNALKVARLYSLPIRNAVIARPDGSTLAGDLACEHGLIARIDTKIDAAAEETIDAQGQLLPPGVIDTHVHFREPGKEDLWSPYEGWKLVGWPRYTAVGGRIRDGVRRRPLAFAK